MSAPPASPGTSLATRLFVIALMVGAAAFVVLCVVLAVLDAQRDPVDEMRRVNDVAAKVAALEPALRDATNVPAACPKDFRPHRDAGSTWPPPVIDADELPRFAPPDAGRSTRGPKPGAKAEWRFSWNDLAKLKPWQDPRFDRDAAQSAEVAAYFERGYVIVLEALSVDEPHVERALVGQDTFVSGHVRGRATLFDLEGARALCRTTFEAENSDNVEWRQRDSYAEAAVHHNLEVRTVNAAQAAIERLAPALGVHE